MLAAKKAAHAATKVAAQKSRRARPMTAEERREYNRAWRAAHPSYKKTWKAANPDKVRADRRGRGGKSNVRRRAVLMKVQKGRCGYCRTKLEPGKIHIDHVMPRALGGSNRRSNLQLLCEACNLSKGAKHPVAFAQSIGRLI